MPVIAFAALVVVPDNTLAVSNENEAVLVLMRASRHRPRHLPDARLDKQSVVELTALFDEQYRFHPAGKHDNILVRCQWCQHAIPT
jgi:hypothetical protein